MDIGSLTVEVIADSKGRRLLVQGRVYGVETDVTEKELRSLAAFLQRVADEAAKEA